MVREMNVKVFKDSNKVFEGHIFDFLESGIVENIDNFLLFCEALQSLAYVIYSDEGSCWKVEKIKGCSF
jgi:hypothetical protein